VCFVVMYVYITAGLDQASERNVARNKQSRKGGRQKSKTDERRHTRCERKKNYNGEEVGAKDG
jgi:hypothetical protein